MDKVNYRIKELEDRDTVAAINNVTRRLISDIVKELQTPLKM